MRKFAKESEILYRCKWATPRTIQSQKCSSCRNCFWARGIVSVVYLLYSQREASHLCETLQELLHDPPIKMVCILFPNVTKRELTRRKKRGFHLVPIQCTSRERVDDRKVDFKQLIV